MYETPSEGVVPPVSDKPAAPPVASRLTALEAGHAAVIRNLNDTVWDLEHENGEGRGGGGGYSVGENNGRRSSSSRSVVIPL